MVALISYVGMNQPARLEAYERLFAIAAADTYTNWSTRPTIPLFRASSDLILRCTMTAFFGPSFVARHGDELVPLVREFERAFVHPLTRVVPLWASPVGRRLRRVYRRLKEVIEAEVRERFERGEQDTGDYLGFLLATEGAEDFFDCYGEHLVRRPSRLIRQLTDHIRR